MSTWLTLKTALEGFLMEGRARRLSENTLADYHITLKQFLQFVGDVPVNSITPAQVVAFLATFNHLKPKSLLNKYVGLSAFWTWLVKEGYTDNHLIRKIPRPRANPPVIQPFSEDDIKAMFRVLGRKNDRNRVIILLLLDTGIRASELLNLEWSDIDLANRRIKVLGKGHKERYVPISPRTATALFRYRATCKDARPFDLTRTRLAHLLQEIGQRAGVPRVFPHRFRHTFAVMYLRNGGDIFTLQAILGHASLEMVRRYLVIAQVDVDLAHKRASPVENWKL